MFGVSVDTDEFVELYRASELRLEELFCSVKDLSALMVELTDDQSRDD